jgi:hypothetical protein
MELFILLFSSVLFSLHLFLVLFIDLFIDTVGIADPIATNELM